MEYFPLVSSAIDHVHVLLNGGESPEVCFHALRLNLVQFYSFIPSCETFSCNTLFLSCKVAHVCERSIEIIRDGIVKEKNLL